MKFLIIAFIISFTFANSPKAVDFVDINRFSGLWYEIARTYNSFEKNCVAATVEYTLTQPYKYQVNNRCFNKVIGADLIEYKGSAKPTKDDKNINYLDMTYYWVFTKSYKVIYLNKNYTRAIVVDDAMDAVWIMSRTPFIDKDELNRLVSFLSSYMDISRLIYTPQDQKGKYK